MKQAKISELKAHLSSYLALVRRGEVVVICDRETPIARIVPVEDALDGFRVEEATRPTKALRKVRGVALSRPANVQKLLREDRDQR